MDRGTGGTCPVTTLDPPSTTVSFVSRGTPRPKGPNLLGEFVNSEPSKLPKNTSKSSRKEKWEVRKKSDHSDKSKSAHTKKSKQDASSKKSNSKTSRSHPESASS